MVRKKSWKFLTQKIAIILSVQLQSKEEKITCWKPKGAPFQHYYNVFETFIFNDLCPVFCGTVFLLLDCRMFAFTFYCFAARVWVWGWNANNKMGIPLELE